MPRTSRTGKLPRGPKGKAVVPPPLPTKQTSRSSSRRNSSVTNKKSTVAPPDLSKLKTPSDVLSSVLSTLDLSFDKDIGMIKGHHVKNLPTNKQTLLELQTKLNLLNDLFNQIIKDDNTASEQIRQLEWHIVENESLTKKSEEVEPTKEDSITSKVEEKTPSQQLETVPIHPETDVAQQSDVEITPAPETKSQDPPSTEILKPVETPVEEVKPSLETTDSTINITVDDTSVPATVQADEVSQDTAENADVSIEPEQDKKRPLPEELIQDEPESSEEPETKKTKLNEIASVETSVDSTLPLPVQDKPTPITATPATTTILDTSVSNNNNNNNNNNIPAEVTPTPSTDITKDEDPNPMDKYTSDNDTRVKNPKSEFVVSQTLPLAAKNLGLYNEEGLETTGEEYLKKKYNVASYPTNDLKDLLPGVIPDTDYSCPKPANQIQFNTFLTFVDNFFKAFTDNDIKFLENKYIAPNNLEMDKNYDPEVSPFIIPKLGPLYTNVWMKEDAKTLGNISPLPYRDSTSILPKRSAASLDDSALEAENISCGPLLSRLLSAILQDEKDDAINEEMNHERDMKYEMDAAHTLEDPSLTAQTSPVSSVKDEREHLEHNTSINHITPVMTKDLKLGGGTTNTIPNVDDWNINSLNLDYPTFEERLKRELKYVGIYMNLPKDENNPNGDDPDWLNGREDDEISAELRELQSSLKEVTKRNQRRKEIVKPLLERELAWQEYYSILDDLDKQIDQAYIKRIRAPKKKKKHHGSSSSSTNHHGTGSSSSNYVSASQLAQQKAANSSLKALLDKRQRWISKIGPLFDKPEIMKRIPKESIFKDMDQDEEEEEADGDVFGQNNENKEDDLTEA